MPAIIGVLQIVSINENGIAHLGNRLITSLNTQTKMNSGSSGFTTGGILMKNIGISGTDFLDLNLIDQPGVGNIEQWYNTIS